MSGRPLTGFRIEPATDADIPWIAGLEAAAYAKSDAIPERTLREWFAVNPSGFSIVRDPHGNAIGHLDILPLRPATLDAFRKGDIVERDIGGDALYSPTERGSITDLYVESIVLKPQRAVTKGSALLFVLGALGSIVERVADPKTVERLYAIAATSAGEKLIRKLGFEPESVAERRRDSHPLFVVRAPDLAARVASFPGGSAVYFTTSAR